MTGDRHSGRSPDGKMGRRAGIWSQWRAISLLLVFSATAAAASEPAAPGSVVDQVIRHRTWEHPVGSPSDPPLELHAAWSERLEDPVPPGLLMLDAASGQSAGLSLWTIAGAALGVLVGSLTTWLLMRRRPKTESATASGRSRATGPSSSPTGDIELVTSQVLADDGAILVVDVLGEQLVLGVSGKRDYVTLLTRLGDEPGPLPPFGTARLEDVLAAAGRAGAGPGGPGSSPTPGQRATATPSPANGAGTTPARFDRDVSADEDLEELLDELLGKVRGLKPLAKRSDET